MNKRIAVFFILIILIILVFTLIIINQNKISKNRNEFCEINEGEYDLEKGLCKFLFGEKSYDYTINLKDKCFFCAREECLYNNILEVKGVLCE